MSDHSNNRVLRALPYRPPQESKPQTGIKRSTLVAGGVAAVGLVLLAAGTVVFLNASHHPVAAAPNVEPVKEVKPPAPRPTPVAAKTLSTNDRHLKALGGLTAAHLYQSYLNIGLLADGVESEAYPVADAQKMLTVVVSLMDLVDAQLRDVSTNNLSAEDLESLEQIRALSALLRTQANALRGFWDTGDPTQATRYHEVRERAWKALGDTLGLQ